MRWTPKDIDIFLQAKEYVDSAFLCFASVSLSDTIRESAQFYEWASGLSVELEKQYKGRVLFVPPIVYPAGTGLKETAELWVRKLKEQGFIHVFLLVPESERPISGLSEEGGIHVIPAAVMQDAEDGEDFRSKVRGQADGLRGFFADVWESGWK